MTTGNMAANEKLGIALIIDKTRCFTIIEHGIDIYDLKAFFEQFGADFLAGIVAAR